MSLDNINVEFFEAVLAKIPRDLSRYGEPDSLQYSVDTDAVVYVDEEGLDTASFGWGAEGVLERFLEPNEIEVMQSEGFYIKDDMIFAFSRFLLVKFIEQSFNVEILKARAESSSENFKHLYHTVMDLQGDGEEEPDLELLEVTK